MPATTQVCSIAAGAAAVAKPPLEKTHQRSRTSCWTKAYHSIRTSATSTADPTSQAAAHQWGHSRLGSLPGLGVSLSCLGGCRRLLLSQALRLSRRRRLPLLLACQLLLLLLVGPPGQRHQLAVVWQLHLLRWLCSIAGNIGQTQRLTETVTMAA